MNAFAEYTWELLPVALGLSAGLGWLLIPLAHRVGLVDQPAGRKVHETATPLVGGLAVFAALTVAVIVSPLQALAPSQIYLAVLLGGGILLLTGLIDDLRGLSPHVRFVVQIGACGLLMYLTGLRLHDFGPLFTGDVLELGRLAVPITIFAALGVINAFNLADGMDGLSGSIFCVAAAGMALFAGLAGMDGMLWLLLYALAAVLGFLLLNARLPWNPTARVFLGDAGSLMLGFVLAWSFIRLGSGPERAFMPMTAVWLFAVPLLDTSTLIWTRWRTGHSAFAADRHHLHHAFLRAGYSVGQACGAITALAIALAGIGILLEISGLPGYVSFYAFMVFAFTYYFYLRHSWTSQRFLGRHFIHHDFVMEEPIPYTPTSTARKPVAAARK